MDIYKIMIANALVLIALGVYGFISSGSPTALIAPGIGVILLILSFPTKKENKTAAHIAVALTLVSTIMFFVIGLRRGNVIVLIMAVFTLLALILYVMHFLKRRNKNSNPTS